MRPVGIAVAAAIAVQTASAALAQTVSLEGIDGQALTISAAALQAMPHQALTLTSEDGKAVRYEGVPLSLLLQKVGAPAGKALRGPEMADVVIVSASDGYRVALSLAETDASLRGEAVLLADRADGAALTAHDGPFRLIVEGDRRPARAERMVANIRLVRPAEREQDRPGDLR